MNTKRILALTLSALMAFSLTACSSSSSSDDGTFTPTKNISFVCASSAGGGADLFSREVSSLMDEVGAVEKSIVVSNETDGGGEVARNRVATATNDDHLLMGFMSGAVTGMLTSTDLRMENFTPLAILATENSLFFKGEHTSFDDFSDFIEAAQSGEKIVIGGSKSDDVSLKNMVLEQLGIDPISGNVEYIIYDSTSDALVALLGGHIELCIGKPSSTIEYVNAGRIEPVLVASTERLTAPFDTAPTLSELGDFEDVEMSIWRSVVGPADMSDEAAAYYIDALEAVANSTEWAEYCEANLLSPVCLLGDDAEAYMLAYQDTVIASMAE